MTRYFITKHTAKADYRPDDKDLYAYATQYGTFEDFNALWAFTDLKQALEELSTLETTCEQTKDGKYWITCYALERVDI